MAAVELSEELKAMAALEGALGSLPDEARQRVLRWGCDRFGVQMPSAKGKPSAHQEDAIEDKEGDLGEQSRAVEGLAEFYDRAGPESDADKALVVAYWYQFREGQSEIEAQRVNTELKHLGYRVGNITRAFEGLKGQKPALIVQLRKEGSTKQARKKFKVTAEGKKAVEKMLAKQD